MSKKNYVKRLAFSIAVFPLVIVGVCLIGLGVLIKAAGLCFIGAFDDAKAEVKNLAWR